MLLRRTENSLRVGDELQERRNTAVSLLISARGGAFQVRFLDHILVAVVFLDIVVTVL